MHNKIQNPRADYTGSDHPGATSIAADAIVNSANEQRPHEEHQQTVGNRVVSEVEWRNSGDAGNDLYMLHAAEQKNWPQQVSKLSRQNQSAQRSSGRDFFAGQSDTEVSDKHFTP